MRSVGSNCQKIFCSNSSWASTPTRFK